MSIQAINKLNQSATTQTFKSTEHPSEIAYQEEKSSNTKYWILGGLTALAAIGTYLLIKNRNKKTSTSEIKETVTEFKNMTLEEFKKAGNVFESGKAKSANGELYTGTIKRENSDKSVLTLEYKNGILQKSSKIKDGKNIFDKTYTHNVSGDLRKVINKDGKTLDITVENDIKKIRTSKNNTITYDIDKKKLLSYQKNGANKKEYFYRDDDGKKLKYIKENNKITKFAKDGKTEIFSATESEAQNITNLCKNLGNKFDFSELKNLMPFINDKWGRARGTITGGTPVARPKIKTPKSKDYTDTAKKIWDAFKIKKAFEETKESHFI